MTATDNHVLELLQKALSACVCRNKGWLTCPDVVRASQELDKVILKFMKNDRRET